MPENTTSQSPTEEKFQQLLQALKHKKSSERSAALYALGERKDTRAVEPICRALRDPKWEVRWSAIQALVAIGEPGVEPLCHA